MVVAGVAVVSAAGTLRLLEQVRAVPPTLTLASVTAMGPPLPMVTLMDATCPMVSGVVAVVVAAVMDSWPNLTVAVGLVAVLLTVAEVLSWAVALASSVMLVPVRGVVRM